MNRDDIQTAVKNALASGNWIVRGDNDGLSYGDFRWSPIGEWTEAPDWDGINRCGGGLHGQGMNHGGFSPSGPRLVFCDFEGDAVPVGLDKVKVKKARILMVNSLPDGLNVGGSLDLSGTQITTLPDGLNVGGDVIR